MSPADEFDIALAASTAASARVAYLDGVKVELMALVNQVVEGRLLSMSDEDRLQLDHDSFGRSVRRGISAMFEKLTDAAEDTADKASNFVDDLTVEAEEAAHAARAAVQSTTEIFHSLNQIFGRVA